MAAGNKIAVWILGDSSSYEKSLANSSKATSSFGSNVSKAAKVVSAAFIGGIAVAAKIGFDELKEAEAISAQTTATLKATGGAANVTAGDIETLAGSLSRMSGVDDEAIQQGENLLLTFKNVRNEVGKGNAIFDRATAAALDLSVALGKDVPSQAKLLGKALDDPIKGLSGLRRVGVSFTEDQKKLVKAMVESGDTMGAQKMILEELEGRYKGSAKAAGETMAGQINKAKNAFAEMAASLVEALLPAITAFAGIVAKASVFLSEHKRLTMALVGVIATLSAAVLGVNIALKVYRTATLLAAAAQRIFNTAALANPYVAAVAAIAAIVAALVVLEEKFGVVSTAVGWLKDAFSTALEWVRSNWPEIATLISGPFAPIVALATDAFGVRSAIEGAFRAVKTWVSQNWPVIAMLISGPFAPLVALATDAFGVRSALEGALTAAKTWVGNRIDEIVGFFVALPGRLAAMLGNLATTAIEPFKDTFTGAKTWVGQKIDDVVGFFTSLPGRILATLTSLTTTALDPFRTAFETAGELVRKALNKIDAGIDLVKAGVKWIGNTAAGIIESGVQAITTAVQKVTDAFGPLASVIGAIVSAVQWLIDNIPKIPTPDFPDLPGPGGGIPFVPGVAMGGPVRRGSTYIVGERGPELFVPSGDGEIVPNGNFGVVAGGARGGTSVVNVFEIAGSVVAERELLELVRRGSISWSRRSGELYSRTVGVRV